MSEPMVLNLYKLCKSYDLHGLINKFGNTFNNIDEMNEECLYNNDSTFDITLWNSNFDYIDFNSITYYAFYKAWCNTLCKSKNISRPILDWLQKLNPDICLENITENYSIDEIISNDALDIACRYGHYKVIKWLINEECYLSSFKNR